MRPSERANDSRSWETGEVVANRSARERELKPERNVDQAARHGSKSSSTLASIRVGSIAWR
jgi:hypothetical protein